MSPAREAVGMKRIYGWEKAQEIALEFATNPILDKKEAEYWKEVAILIEFAIERRKEDEEERATYGHPHSDYVEMGGWTHPAERWMCN